MKKLASFGHEFLIFGVKEARSAVFAGSFFVLLFLSNYIHIPGLARYDFIFLASILLQVILYLTKIETWDEVKVIFLFHIIGFVLEVYKTNPAIGSWSYPEPGFFKIANVPLYSGFMYAAIGSYIAQSWRIMKLELINFKNYRWSILLCAFSYLNFFTNHFLPDIRYILILFVFILFWNVKVRFTVTEKRRSIPLTLSFVLIAFFIWIAENISTFWGAWQYPNQVHSWNIVSSGKITSWFLMVIISFIIVAYLKHVKERQFGQTSVK
jgi:uncharacterized membrane protein YoaT (DUF817 family)